MESDNEMLDVQSRYTACVGRQDLPRSTKELYRLVARLAGHATESDPHPFTSADASDAVRCIDRYIRETDSIFRAIGQDLSIMNEDSKLFRFHTIMGDYAGALCNALIEEKSLIS